MFAIQNNNYSYFGITQITYVCIDLCAMMVKYFICCL